ncbi:MAG: metal transporter [Anaerolineae bacterium]|nr:metal transporter [Anaerolineae bacterium]
MAEKLDAVRQQRAFGLPAAIFLILPLLLLAGIIVLFLTTGGGLQLTSPVPVEDLAVERTVLKPGSIDISLRNAGPEDLTVAQVIINDAIWPAELSPSRTIPRLGTATLHLDYHWVEGEAYAIRILTGNAIAFDVDVPVAFATPQPDGGTLLGFTLIGLYVGILPVYLGLLWFPALRQLGRRWMVFLLAVTAGLLIFLGLDTLVEGLEQVAGVPGPFQGIGLFGIGAVGTFLLLLVIGRRQAGQGRSGASRRLGVATLIAVGIGLHNLGEGLAIGTAYNLGEVSLGVFLVVGFIVQNITEGLGIIAPILRDRPRVRQLALLGLIGGAPAIAGAWIGGLAPSPTLAVLFFGIGTGAIFEVVYEIGGMVRKDVAEQPMQLTVLAGVMAGMLLLWGTGLLIK